MTYAQSGVDIDAGDEMVAKIKRHMQRTYNPRVLNTHGAFAGCFRLDYNEKLFKRNYKDPVLVSCADGVGSKVKLAIELNIYDTVGIDVVAMNVNDMIVQGAEPLFFLDYIGTNKLEPDKMADIVKGVADGCQLANCALLGGETAELPDLYAPNDFDLAGFAVGVCELKRMVNSTRIQRGDVILGLESSGIHSNGFSLVRAIIKQAKLDLDKSYPQLDDTQSLGQILLTPTRIYVKTIIKLLRSYRVKHIITAMAHITGGGIVNNLNRALTNSLDAKIFRETWPQPPIFKFLAQHGNVETDEMDRVFNQGIGYCIIVRPDFVNSVTAKLQHSGETVHRLGTIVKGSGKVKII